MRPLLLYIFSGYLLLIAGCKKDDAGKHNPGIPMTITSFTPEKGGHSTSVLITGSNFTSDTAAIDVTINGKQLVIIGASSTQIMAVVPKRCGVGKVKVMIGKNSVESEKVFDYIFTRTVTTLAGNGTAGFSNGRPAEAQFNFSGQNWYRSMGLAVDNNLNVYVADPGNHCIRKIDPQGNVTLLAGNPNAEGHADGKGTAAKFALPYDVDVDAQGNVYSVDPVNYDIRKINPDGTATTIGWGAQSPWSIAVEKSSGKVYYASCSSPGNIYHLPATGAQTEVVSGLNWPAGIDFDGQGNLYVSVNGDQTIMKFTASTWASTIIAGQKGVLGYANGAGTEAKFASPWGLAVDAEGNIYAGSNGTWNGDVNNPDQSVRFITPGNWQVSTYAGNNKAGYTDAIGEAASFSAPNGVAVDKNGTVYVLDKNNNRIRKIVSE